jgi:hypothetical protein
MASCSAAEAEGLPAARPERKPHACASERDVQGIAAMTLVRWLAVGVVVLVIASRLDAASPTPAGPGDGIQFAPQGSVKRVRQVTARFPTPMVALGDPRAPVDPFTIDCPEKGTSRWVDSRTWSYDFRRIIPAGIAAASRWRRA